MEIDNQNRFEGELFLYPVENELIGNIQINSPKRKLSTIVILDRSDTMDDAVERFVNEILPQVFEKLEYSAADPIHLITFSNQANHIRIPVENFPQMKIYSDGGIYMKPAIETLRNVLENKIPKDSRTIRLLSISVGVAWDEAETEIASKVLRSFIEGKFEINSQAVRLLTSVREEPGDAGALTYALQLNNMTECNLLDLEEELSNEEMSSAISQLFKDDCLNCKIFLHSEEHIFKKSPWITEFSNSVRLYRGENLFWLDTFPTKPVTINESIIQVQIQSELTLEIYEQLLRLQIDHHITQLKLFKFMDKTVPSSTLHNIVMYFQKKENYMLNREHNLQIILNNTSLRSKINYLKGLISRRNKTFSMRIAQIANNEKVSQLNSAQQAEYIKAIDASKNSRGLARRALRKGIDFNETVRKEVRTMSEHLDELKEVCDKDHQISFYSKGTTLGGIYKLCELVQEGLLDDLDAKDILLMFNIVGVACFGPIGNFPDPRTWRSYDLYLGCNASVSDILTVFVKSPGTVLRTPIEDLLITNVIPVFDDNRIATFLKKYAPSSLEYICSIGMRRVIADVPMTCSYTMCAAVWKMVKDLNFKKNEIHLRTFERLVLNYEFFIGKHFEYILSYIKQQGQTNNSYYIGNNGITNMISPLITLYRLNDYKLEFIPDILRALYAYEVWKAIRRLYKHKVNSDTIIQDMLIKLLGIDVDKHKTLLRPLFVSEPDIKELNFSCEPLVSETYLAELIQNFYSLEYVTLIPKYFHAVITGNTKSILHMSELSTETICEALKINYDLKMFRLYNIIQALLFTRKSSRVDVSKEVMKIADLKYEQEGQKMVRDYIQNLFKNKYLSDLAVKKRTEKVQLAHILVESILRATNHEDIVDLMKNGITRGKVHIKIVNSSSLGFLNLKQKLVDLKQNIPLRANIIKIFLLGRDYMDNNAAVWNNGVAVYVKKVSDFEIAFKSTASSQEWNIIYEEYKEAGCHRYRVKLNFHGHGNTKQSYWALGYPTLQHYKNDVTEEEFNKYCTEHANCCGVAKFLDPYDTQKCLTLRPTHPMDNKENYPKYSQMEADIQNRLESELFLYPVENEFIGNIKISFPKRKFTTIVILDGSDRMDVAVERFVNKILPQVFEKLDYSFGEPIHLITFGDEANHICTPVENFPQLKFICTEDICMRPAIDALKKVLVHDVPKDNRTVRLLIISVGVACDESETEIACNELVSFIKGKFEINSQAVRLITTVPEEPSDAEALTYVLPLNNMTESSLLDVDEGSSNEEISSAIRQLFKNDCLNSQICLHSEEFIFKESPWTTEYSDSIKLHSGENMFWFNKIPTKPINRNESTIQVKIQTDLTLAIYEQLLRLKIDHCITQLKLLKFIDIAIPTLTIDNIVIYFQNYIFNKELNLQIILNNTSVRSKMHYLKALISQGRKTFPIHKGQIANDEKVSLLNSAQQIEYLRTIDASKNSRGLARRALRKGIDFNETVRKEVRAMSEHIEELKEVSDRDHEVSFYSKETTLGGIYTLCELVQKGLLDGLDAMDILSMFNIVGVACSGPIGPFPVPVTWRINELYLGWNISLSDVLTAFVQSSGIALRTPVTEKLITNVIPILDDNRIAAFLRKYAPSSLEYICSIGMRRVIAHIPMTCSYTMCAAVWKMVEALNLKKNEIHLRTFERLVLNIFCIILKTKDKKIIHIILEIMESLI